ncbi:MAG: LytS/YhcK type 5TM receptor domain-containing protein, partial [Bacillota bacterium]|nr:LytS/YhcK type 5TM receptor domain-containing protein [Bacillota bacterium]
LLALVFGGISIIGWYFGVRYGLLRANMRYIPGIVGGLFGGPAVGIGSLAISGLLRILDDPGGLRGFYTGISMGAIGGFAGMYFKQKRIKISTVNAGYVAVLAMVAHFLILTLFESSQYSIKILLELGWMLYLLNIAGVIIFVNILQQEFRRIDHQKSLSSLAIMEERDRIAKDLHDGFAQTLFYLNTKTVTLKKSIVSGNTTKALDELEQVKDVIQGGFTDIRQTIFNLRSVISIEGDFFTNLKEYLQKFQFQNCIATELIIESHSALPKFALETEIHLFRIVQEALNNALKHAEASKITLRAKVIKGMVELTIEDNGKGFDIYLDKASRRKKFGLVNMQERAWSIGAKYTLESDLGSGTRIRLTIPIE